MRERKRTEAEPDWPMMARIRDARKRAGLSQAELGALLGLSSTSVRNWERKGVPLERLGQIADAISEHAPQASVSAAWLQFGDETGDLAGRVRSLEAQIRTLSARFDRQLPDQH